jgi:hypothetical protein
VLVVPAAVAGLPVLLSPSPAASKIDRLEAMEEWTRSLSGVLTVGIGLEEALVATLAVGTGCDPAGGNPAGGPAPCPLVDRGGAADVRR